MSMIKILANRTYRHLLFAQIIALGLLAYDLAGGNTGAVLGTALAIKMVAYIDVAPIVGAYADRIPRRAFLIAIDVIRACVALALPFVGQVWQVYILIFALQSASAAFAPTFQATIPDEAEYTRALSLSRLAVRRHVGRFRHIRLVCLLRDTLFVFRQAANWQRIRTHFARHPSLSENTETKRLACHHLCRSSGKLDSHCQYRGYCSRDARLGAARSRADTGGLWGLPSANQPPLPCLRRSQA